MANAVSVNAKTINHIVVQLDKLARDVEAIKARVFEKEPPFGSDEWWEWSDKKALEEIKRGEVYGPFENADELLKSLHKESAK